MEDFFYLFTKLLTDKVNIVHIKFQERSCLTKSQHIYV